MEGSVKRQEAERVGAERYIYFLCLLFRSTGISQHLCRAKDYLNFLFVFRWGQRLSLLCRDGNEL